MDIVDGLIRNINRYEPGKTDHSNVPKAPTPVKNLHQSRSARLNPYPSVTSRGSELEAIPTSWVVIGQAVNHKGP